MLTTVHSTMFVPNQIQHASILLILISSHATAQASTLISFYKQLVTIQYHFQKNVVICPFSSIYTEAVSICGALAIPSSQTIIPTTVNSTSGHKNVSITELSNKLQWLAVNTQLTPLLHLTNNMQVLNALLDQVLIEKALPHVLHRSRRLHQTNAHGQKHPRSWVSLNPKRSR